MLKAANCEDIKLIGFHSPKPLDIYRPSPDQSSFQTTSCNQMNDSRFNTTDKRLFCNCLNLSPTPDALSQPQILCCEKQTCQTLSSSGHPKYNCLGSWEKCSNQRMNQEGLRDLPSEEDLSSRIVVLPAYTTVCQSWKSDKDIGSYINTSKLAPIIKWENLLTGDEEEACTNQGDSKPWKFYKSKVNFRDDDNCNSPNSYWSGLDQTSVDVANNNLQNATTESKTIDQNKKVFRSSCYFELQENNRLVMTKGLATMPHLPSEPINAESSTHYSPEGVIPKIFVSFNGDSYTSRIQYYINTMNDSSSKISPQSHQDEPTYSSQENQTSENCNKQPHYLVSDLHHIASEFKPDYNKTIAEPTCISNSSSYEEIKIPGHSEDSSLNDRNNPLSHNSLQSRDIKRNEKHDKCITLVADDQVFKWTPNSENFQIQIDHVSMTRSLNESFFARKLKKFGSKRNISLSELVSEKSKSRLKFLESKMETIKNLGKSNLQDNKLVRFVRPLSPKCLKQLFKKDDGHSEMKQTVPTIIISDEEDLISVQTKTSECLLGEEIKIYPKHEKDLPPTKDKSKHSSDLKLRIEPSVSSGAVTLFFNGCLDENLTQKSESSISDDSSDEQSGIAKQKDVFRSSKSVTFSLDTKTGSPVVRKKMRTGFFASPEDWTCLPDISGNIQSRKWNNPSDDDNQTHDDFPSLSLSKMKNYFFSKKFQETSIYYDGDFESKTKEAKLCFKKMKSKNSSTRRYCVLHAICLIGVENLENLFRMQLPVTIQLEGSSSQLLPRQQSNDDDTSTKEDWIKNKVPAKRPTTLVGLKSSTEMELYDGSRKSNNQSKGDDLRHLAITERDILQV